GRRKAPAITDASALRAVLADAMAPAAWRGTAHGAPPREPARHARDRGPGHQGPRAGGGRHYRPPKAVAHPTDARLTRDRWPPSHASTASGCGKAISGWPSGPPSWSGAIPMPTSSSAPTEPSGSCAFGSVGCCDFNRKIDGDRELDTAFAPLR